MAEQVEPTDPLGALLHGPCWQGELRPRPASRWPELAALPFFVLILAALVAVAESRGFNAMRLWRGLTVAAGGTATCMLLALPVSAARPGPLWLVPAWLAVSIGAAGCSLLPDAVPAELRLAVVLLPFMVVGLSAKWAATPAGLWQAAAASGAGPLQSLGLIVPSVWQGALRMAAVVFLLGASVLAGNLVAGMPLAWPSTTP